MTAAAEIKEFPLRKKRVVFVIRIVVNLVHDRAITGGISMSISVVAPSSQGVVAKHRLATVLTIERALATAYRAVPYVRVGLEKQKLIAALVGVDIRQEIGPCRLPDKGRRIS